MGQGQGKWEDLPAEAKDTEADFTIKKGTCVPDTGEEEIGLRHHSIATVGPWVLQILICSLGEIAKREQGRLFQWHCRNTPHALHCFHQGQITGTHLNFISNRAPPRSSKLIFAVWHRGAVCQNRPSLQVLTFQEDTQEAYLCNKFWSKNTRPLPIPPTPLYMLFGLFFHTHMHTKMQICYPTKKRLERNYT